MRFLSVRDLRSKTNETWKILHDEGEMVVTSNGRPIAILSPVSETNLEESLSAIRQARAVSAVLETQAESARVGTDALSLDEINDEIAAVRRERSASATEPSSG